MTFLSEAWYYIEEVAKYLATLAGILGALGLLISSTSKYKKWRDDRRKEKEGLRKVVDYSEEIIDSIAEIHKLKSLSQTVEEVLKSLAIHEEHNVCQDRLIQNSIEERAIIMNSLSALVDWAVENGADSSAETAKSLLDDYKMNAIYRSNPLFNHGGKDKNGDKI